MSVMSTGALYSISGHTEHEQNRVSRILLSTIRGEILQVIQDCPGQELLLVLPLEWITLTLVGQCSPFSPKA